jgi:hypothetical protein
MAAFPDVIIVLNRGSDIRLPLAFEADNGDPIDMTGHSIAIFEGSEWATANGSVAWTDQAGGLALLSADWTDDPEPPAEVWFRLRTTGSGFDEAMPALIVRFPGSPA